MTKRSMTPYFWAGLHPCTAACYLLLATVAHAGPERSAEDGAIPDTAEITEHLADTAPEDSETDSDSPTDLTEGVKDQTPDPPKDADPPVQEDYMPLVREEPLRETHDAKPPYLEDDWPAPARFSAKAYRYLIHQKLDIGVRTTKHRLRETDRGEPFDGSFIGSIDQLRLLPNESPRYHLVIRYAPIPYAGIGYQTDKLVIRTQTSIPRERRMGDRDTDGNLVIDGRMPFVFVRYNWRGWIEPYAEYGRAKYDNSFDPDLEWFADGRRQFVVEDTKASYWSFGLGITIQRHIVIDIYTRNIDMDIDAVYYFRGDDRDPEPFVFPASHRTQGISATIRF